MPISEKRSISRLVFIISAAFLLFGLVFGVGLYSGFKQNAVLVFLSSVWKDVKLVVGEAPNRVPGGDPIHFLQPSRKPGAGVTINEKANDGKLILLASFFNGGNELRLIRRDGSIVARWPVSFSKHFPNVSHLRKPPETDLNVDLHGALINPDGSTVFNYEYGGSVKLSRCNEIIWTLPHPTHHSVETAEAGGYWIPGRRYLFGAALKEFSPLNRMHIDEVFVDDLILRVNEDGTIAKQMSVARILYDNGLEALLTAGEISSFPGGMWDRELVHLNKIGELSSSMASSFRGFEAGDIVISLRAQNLVLVIDSDYWRVKWYRIGPWLRQHDPEFHPGGTITVFNNNAYLFELHENFRSNPATPRVSNIIEVHPANGQIHVAYGGRKNQEFLTVIRGKHHATPEGGFLIVEHEAGRAFEVDAQGRTVWEYINRYDADQVLEINDARLYPSSYFTVKDWGCPSGKPGAAK